jgi:hypothetical protein
VKLHYRSLDWDDRYAEAMFTHQYNGIHLLGFLRPATSSNRENRHVLPSPAEDLWHNLFCLFSWATGLFTLRAPKDSRRPYEGNFPIIDNARLNSANKQPMQKTLGPSGADSLINNR